MKTIQDYLNSLPEERKQAINKLREVITENLPEGFTEVISYGTIGYVVPHTLYPAGYHCDNKLPLPFMNIASKKNFISLHHIGLYADKDLLAWFEGEYPKYSKTKLDMGKGCMRFKNPDKIPYELIAELARKITVEQWINLYEKELKSPKILINA